MDKNSFRTNQTSTKGLVSSDSVKKNQDGSSKQWPRSSRRRESSNYNSSSKTENPLRKSKPTQTQQKPRYNNFNDKRPRPRGGYQQGNGDSFQLPSTTSTGLVENENGQFLEAELNSVFLPGSKKQNLNHLLNFHYVPRERDNPPTFSKFGNNRSYVKKSTYNKEHFLQANCQFVVNSSGDYSASLSSADSLVEWTNVEQIIIQGAEVSHCPICLYPPTAGKMTKCGHVYCYPCILHYLALSDKSYRKCPICYESVYIDDLKSALSKPYRNYNIGDTVTFQLMRREKSELNIAPADSKITTYKIPHLFDTSENKIHSKLILANRDEIMTIIEQERVELDIKFVLEGDDCPESVFIHQALDLLKERQTKLETVKIHEEQQQLPEDMDRQNSVSDTASSVDFDFEKMSILDDESDQASVHDLQDISPSFVTDSSQFFYFYQASDGQHLYLHSINVRMLQATYGSLENAPTTIVGRILQKQCYSMTEEIRKRLKYLRHLPVTCQFEVVEIQLNDSVLSSDVVEHFKAELEARKKSRKRRAREERIRERHILEVNERQLGKVLEQSVNIDIDSTTHFPSCGSFESTLSPVASYNEEHFNNGGYNSTTDSLLSSSPQPSSSVGTSFAKMLTTAPKTTWPSLQQPSSSAAIAVTPQPKITQVTGSKHMQLISTPTRSKSSNRSVDSDDEIEEENCPRVSEFKQSFSLAIAEALERADKHATSEVNATISSNNNSSGGKKKKNKKTVLFSTGIAFNGN